VCYSATAPTMALSEVHDLGLPKSTVPPACRFVPYKVPSMTCALRSPRPDPAPKSSCVSASLSVKKSESVIGSATGVFNLTTLWFVGEWSAPLLPGRLHSPSPWYPLSKLVMLVTLVTKLLGARGAAEDREDGPVDVAPNKQIRNYIACPPVTFTEII